MTRTEPTDRTAEWYRDLASHQARLRAALHRSVEDRLVDPETWHTDDHTLSLGGDGNGNAVLVIDGADVTLDDGDVLDLVHRLLVPIARQGHAHWRVRAATADITVLVERPEPF